MTKALVFSGGGVNHNKFMMACQINDQFNNAGSNFFFNFGESSGNLAEANRSGVFIGDGRVTRMGVIIVFSSTTTDETLTFRLALGDTTLVLTIGAGLIGTFTAIGNIPVANGDRFSSQISAIGVGEVMNVQGKTLMGELF